MSAVRRLTDAEVRTYRTDGLLVSPFSISEDLLMRMRASLERLLTDNPEIPTENLICPHIRSGAAHDEQAAGEWLEYATQAPVLDLVEQLIGPDIILWGSQVFCKPPVVGREVPWHQDGQYWPIKPLATCSVWMALDDVDTENGCMR